MIEIDVGEILKHENAIAASRKMDELWRESGQMYEEDLEVFRGLYTFFRNLAGLAEDIEDTIRLDQIATGVYHHIKR